MKYPDQKHLMSRMFNVYELKNLEKQIQVSEIKKTDRFRMLAFISYSGQPVIEVFAICPGCCRFYCQEMVIMHHVPLSEKCGNESYGKRREKDGSQRMMMIESSEGIQCEVSNDLFQLRLRMRRSLCEERITNNPLLSLCPTSSLMVNVPDVISMYLR